VKLLIAIPALNEEDSISQIIERCLEARGNIIRNSPVAEVEITVISDGSTDRTVELASSFKPRINLVVFEKNRGYGAAIKEAWRQSDAELLSFLDADGTCDPNFFVALCQTLVDQQACVVLGSRLHSGSKMPLIRRIGNVIFASLLSVFSSSRVRDSASGMRVVRRDCLERLLPLSDGLDFTPAMSAQCILAADLPIREIAMPYAERAGRSKLHVVGDGLRFLGVILKTALLYRPSRVLGLVALVLLLGAAALMARPTLYYLRNHAVQEWMIYRFVVSQLLGTAASAPLVRGQARRKPNFLFLIADDHAGYVLGADGNRLAETPNLDALVGTGESARRIKLMLPRAAAGATTVLIRGESGTGKNLVARILHSLSPRNQGPFIQFNCAALPETLAESELFGYEKGAFTGAAARKEGRFEMADGGTLFLDEVADLSPVTQPKILRVLQEGEFERVGGTRTSRVDVRIVTATNQDLAALVREKRFREDLFYRLNVIQICVPPLRARRDDIPGLLRHFFERASRHAGVEVPTVTVAALRSLQTYAWPGNIRELRNVVERLVVRDPGRPVDVDDLPHELRSAPVPSSGPSRSHPIANPVDVALDALSFETVADRLWRRLQTGECFWTCVSEPFRNHDLTRADVRALVQRGLGHTQGSYVALLKIFNVPAEDYKRVLSFLRQNDCHVPFQPFRAIKPHGAPADTHPSRRAAV
jgi:transcriptional regulator with AAA-type ATPase domain/glycosyltransferase involved in cell wall biosynthesis